MDASVNIRLPKCGMTGLNGTAKNGPNVLHADTRLCRLFASIANPPADFSPTWTKIPTRFASSKAIPSTLAAAEGTAPKDPPRIIKFMTLNGFCIHLKESENAAKANGNVSPGNKPYLKLRRKCARADKNA